MNFQTKLGLPCSAKKSYNEIGAVSLIRYNLSLHNQLSKAFVDPKTGTSKKVNNK